jgi:hypothetical protein
MKAGFPSVFLSNDAARRLQPDAEQLEIYSQTMFKQLRDGKAYEI